MPLNAGWGAADLTPPLGIELAGYGYYINRRATSVRDKIYARALALSDDRAKALIVSCDLLGVNDDIVRRVKDAANRLGFTDEQITIVSIHTHTGPCMIYHLGCGEVDPDFVATVADKIILAVQAAVADMRPVSSLKTGVSPLAGDFAYNRAIEGGPVDTFVRGAILAREGAPSIALVSFACHGVSLGRVPCVSADFSGEVHRLLAARGMKSIYINGLCGDIDPVARESVAEREAKMLLFAEAIEKAFLRDVQPAPLTLASGRIPFALRVMTLTPEEIRKTADEAVAGYGDETLPTSRIARMWEERTLSLGELPDHEDIFIPYVRLGDLTIVSFPFEGYTRTGDIIRETLHNNKVITLGCAEQLLGYLPAREDIKKQSYAAMESAFHYKRMPAVAGEAERLGEIVGHALRNEGIA